MEEILKQIVEKRIKTIESKGINFGINIPQKREVPLTPPDLEKGVIICEIKRGSPSEGKMNNIDNPVEWVSHYEKGGANTISVLTEEDFFLGSLSDLILIKKQFPHLTILRKDFLLSEEEIEISYRIGADMVLLIASILPYQLLEKMKNKAESLGLTPLIEIHNEDELKKILPLKPKLIGINSRDLKTFKLDRNYPYALKKLIEEDNILNNYKSFVVFESGIRNYTDSFFVANAGFSGILVGTSIIKSGELTEKILDLKNGFISGLQSKKRFYPEIFKKIYIDKKIVIKICGITNILDANYAIKEGVDILGFVFAESPRKIEINKAKEILSEIGDRVLKVGVVVSENIEEIVTLVKEGFLDAIQFHNDFTNDKCMSYNVCWYKATRVKENSDFDKQYYSPITLFDAFSKDAMGGTGKQIDPNLLLYAKEKNIPLCLAGGINPDNVKTIITEYHPILIDVSSGLEEKPGKKDFGKIDKFFSEVKFSFL
ncbi:MAG: hypothetical protein A2086_10105 [Spirochaetes bacterium GWD1_27_9]|nr:MAG: hypothetical protein A2Z98_05550 [Spirochaetes bacterium GWB1_27_13]OHD23733.1 MAG: hypothetical protein A2Y34_17670 [Spirochaetes bacterium GWC1_27_15]OHD42281.1 MAG: hypothetical protein A2086_10105 [Spirochaetes bacterium GWD1_27_9]